MITAHDPYQTMHPNQLSLPLPLDAESEALCTGFKEGYRKGHDSGRNQGIASEATPRQVMHVLKNYRHS